MATTWHDIKLATLQKMFAAEGNTIPTDESTTDYIAAMPYVCNEALQQIATAGKFVIKSVQLAHFPTVNIIPDDVAKAIHTIYNGDKFVISADGAKSVAMDIFGHGTLRILVDENLVDEVLINNPNSFEERKENISNPSDGKVTYEFTAEDQLSVKAIGFYRTSFTDANNITPYRKYIRYNMKDIAPDYYQLDSQQVFYEGDKKSEYIQADEYFQEGDKVIVLPRDKAGNYTIYYKAYPEQITIGTSDDYVLPIDPEVATLIPIYMASELYKDDDNAIATTYRNEFEVAFERLTQKTNVPVAERYASKSGWI